MSKRSWRPTLLSMGVAAICFAWNARAELKTVAYVDPAKYMGDWFQIAHIPMWFEFGNCSCARQRLTLLPSGKVGVFNSCNDGGPGGELKTIQGEATIVDTATNAKLSVDFHLPWKGTYWIIGLDEKYRHAVVSDQGESTLYILSRTPTLEEDLYKDALAIAARQLDTSKLRLTQQTGCRYPN